MKLVVENPTGPLAHPGTRSLVESLVRKSRSPEEVMENLSGLSCLLLRRGEGNVSLWMPPVHREEGGGGEPLLLAVVS